MESGWSVCPMAFGDAILPRGVQLSLENFTRGCEIPRDAISSVTPAIMSEGRLAVLHLHIPLLLRQVQL